MLDADTVHGGESLSVRILEDKLSGALGPCQDTPALPPARGYQRPVTSSSLVEGRIPAAQGGGRAADPEWDQYII